MFNKLNKYFAVLFIIVIFLISCLLPASAAVPKLKGTASKKTVTQGESFFVTYDLTDIDNVKLVSATFEFDSNAFTVVRGEWLTDKITSPKNKVDCTVNSFDPSSKKGSLMISVLNEDDDVINGAGAEIKGSLFKLELKVADKAAEGMYTINAKFGPQDASLKKIDLSPVSLDISVKHEHVFENSCDRGCNYCTYVRNVTHDIDSKWYGDNYSHWHKCKLCGEISDFDLHRGGKATCSEKAKCDECKASYGEKLEHKYDEVVKDELLEAEATCKTPATYYKSCKNCGEKSRETFENGEINKDNHVEEFYYKDQVSPTCEKDGYSGDKFCSGCNKEIEKGQEMKGGHKIVFMDTPASCNTNGYKPHYKCTGGCGKLYSDEAGTTEVKFEDVYVEAMGHLFGAELTDVQTNAKCRICVDCGYIEWEQYKGQQAERTEPKETVKVPGGLFEDSETGSSSKDTDNVNDGQNSGGQKKNKTPIIMIIVLASIVLVVGIVLVILKIVDMRKNKYW